MKTKNPNNPNRLNVLAAMRKHPDATVREIAKLTGLSPTAAYHHLTALENEGVVTHSHDRGNRNHRPHKKPIKKAFSKKLTEYAKLGRGENAFVPRKNEKARSLQERIEMVVKKAMQQRQDTTVNYEVSPVLRITKARKIG
jgi:predicted ArsR family transcriptional regulator